MTTETRTMTVIAAAVKDEQGTIYALAPPARHHHCIHLIAERGHRQLDGGGFVLSDGRYVTRKQAAAVAIKAGQIEALKWPGGSGSPGRGSRSSWI